MCVIKISAEEKGLIYGLLSNNGVELFTLVQQQISTMPPTAFAMVCIGITCVFLRLLVK
ncbi:MAG: hypothetical protein RSA91_00510 [Bacilli bacterium]